MLLELAPLLRLRGERKIHRVAGQQAKRAVVVVRLALPIPARWRIAIWRRRLAHVRPATCAGIRAELQQRTFDRLLEGSLGNVNAHATSSRTSILPVTAAKMMAVRSSFRRWIASRILPTSASILVDSPSRKLTMATC